MNTSTTIYETLENLHGRKPLWPQPLLGLTQLYHVPRTFLPLKLVQGHLNHNGLPNPRWQKNAPEKLLKGWSYMGKSGGFTSK